MWPRNLGLDCLGTEIVHLNTTQGTELCLCSNSPLQWAHHSTKEFYKMLINLPYVRQPRSFKDCRAMK
jgi:hypothetical protein